MKYLTNKKIKQWLWLIGLWGGSVLSLGVISLLLRLLMNSAGLTS